VAKVLTVTTSSKNYTGTQQGVISGAITGGASGSVTLSITNPAGSIVFSDIVPLASNGSFNDTFHPKVGSLWASGTYIVEASYGTLIATASFSYSVAAAVTATTTVVSTVTSPTTLTATSTVTAPPNTVTSTQTATQTSTQTTTQTATQTATHTSTQTMTETSTVKSSSGGIPDWEYAAIVVLLIVCVAIGFLARNLLEANRNRPATRSVE
jgi:chitinase